MWKREHVSPDLAVGAYTADKRPLVARVLAERGIPLRPDEERLDPALLAERSGGQGSGSIAPGRVG